MRKAGKVLWAIFFLLPLFLSNSGNIRANPIDGDDDAPDIRARVARISFLRGAAQVRHAGDRDWERAAQNLPLVEGDEISTDAGARLEIQFDRDNYLRLSENAYFKITTLRDADVAVSLPEGKLSLRVLRFNKERESFEIDAPLTTVAVQTAGMYRVDAGEKGDAQVRVTVTENGLARIYSENSAFSLRGGRSATIQTGGSYAGEWETAAADEFADEFDSWTLERDAIIAKLLQHADYDKYYDSDTYGAEDLSEYGEWIFTKKYGYVWKPYRAATSSYADWSPYRYGSWRWIPPYGWTWVNDEPWGYATYHHGRWIYVDNDWAWTPYGQHRAARNWWRPALVVVAYAGNLICWYPLPYNYGYYNYNSVYVDRRRYNTTIINNTTVVNQTTVNGGRGKVLDRKPVEFVDVPPTGVVAVEVNDFGRGTKRVRALTTETAKKVIEKTPFETENPPLPEFRAVKSRADREIVAENPRNEQVAVQVRTGATERKTGVPIDEKLRQQRVYGNRAPLERTPPIVETNENPFGSQMRGTGAIKREPRPMPKQDDGNSDTEKSRNRSIAPETFPARPTGGKTDGEGEINSDSKSRNRNRETPPVYQLPPEQPQPRQENKQRRRDISPAPPQQQETPRPTPPRPEPPSKRDQPRETAPPPRQQPAPKEERKVAPPPRDKAQPDKPDNDN